MGHQCPCDAFFQTDTMPIALIHLDRYANLLYAKLHQLCPPFYMRVHTWSGIAVSSYTASAHHLILPGSVVESLLM